MKKPRLMIGMALMLAASGLGFQAQAQEAEPATQIQAPRASRAVGERVTFASRDEAKTELVGYLYRPTIAVEGEAPAVVLMHGRSGAYSSLSDGVYDATTLAAKFRNWAQYWAGRGYYVLFVDSYSTRGFPGGLPSDSASRPASTHEVTARPLDAYGALRYLRALNGVDDDRIGIMGFSNGGASVLATMADDKPGDMRRLGFRAGIAMYPGCSLQNRYRRQGYKAYAPVTVFMGTADTEATHETCRTLVTASAAAGSPIALQSYPDATHSFDDPGRRRQSVPANAAANRQARVEAERFFAEALAPR
jgi:dienelactone hydrolase